MHDNEPNTRSTAPNAHHNRQRKFDGVAKSPVVGSNKQGHRFRYLSFGDPPLGVNGGNTAYNTHRVLEIVRKAKETTRNHGDGGWTAALRVCAMHNHAYHNHDVRTHTLTYHLQYLRTKRCGLPAFRRLLGKPILKDVYLQDVVFAGADGGCVNPVETADRACAAKVGDLTKAEKVLEKQELQFVRKGCEPVVDKSAEWACARKILGYHETEQSWGRALC